MTVLSLRPFSCPASILKQAFNFEKKTLDLQKVAKIVEFLYTPHPISSTVYVFYFHGTFVKTKKF